MANATGTIQSIWRFPIKSFQGESVSSADLLEFGIVGDRPLALRNSESGKILSGKDAKLGERILEFSARYEAEPRSGAPLPGIQAEIDGVTLSVDDQESFVAAISKALGQPVELVTAGSKPETCESYWPELEDLPISGATLDFPLPLAEAGSFADLEPLHVLTTASLAHLAELAADSRIEETRFRPSILINTGDGIGFTENEWRGKTARLGEATLEFGEVAPRCIMTTRAQAGLPRDPTILKTLVRENRQEFMGMQMPCLGIYAKVTTPGAIRVGDELTFD